MAAYGSGYYGKGVYGIGNVVISGNSSTTAVGTLLDDRSIQEDGNIATGNVGSVGISVLRLQVTIQPYLLTQS